jgi:hypothetical protein
VCVCVWNERIFAGVAAECASARRETDVMWWRQWCCKDNGLCCRSGRSFSRACLMEGQTNAYYHFIDVERNGCTYTVEIYKSVYHNSVYIYLYTNEVWI